MKEKWCRGLFLNNPQLYVVLEALVNAVFWRWKTQPTNKQINSAIPKFNSLFLYYYCNTHYFNEELWSKASATTISIVNKSKMESCVFPLPPLPEQLRIVDRIESLFAKLDEAKQKAQDALDSFETRKAAIIHKAFAGELTAQWRKEHGVGMESWRRIALKKCGS